MYYSHYYSDNPKGPVIFINSSVFQENALQRSRVWLVPVNVAVKLHENSIDLSGY